MADTITINANSPTTAVVGTDELTIGGVLQHLQRMKLFGGADGSTVAIEGLTTQPAGTEGGLVTRPANGPPTGISATATLSTVTTSTPFSIGGFTSVAAKVVETGFSGTYQIEFSQDGGTTWALAYGQTSTLTGTLSLFSNRTASTATTVYGLILPVGSTHVRLNATAATAGSVAVTFVGTSLAPMPAPSVADGGSQAFGAVGSFLMGLDDANTAWATRVLTTAPSATEHGLVTRPIPSGVQTVQGNQPTATTFTGVTTATALASVAAASLNVATVTLRTFTGTTPSITFKLQASDDGGTTWVDLQGINNSTGQVGTLWTQAAALAANVAGPSIDYTIGGYTHVRISVTAISGTSATAAFGVSMQAMPYEASPGAVAQGTAAAGAAPVGNPVYMGGTDGTNVRALSTVAKGTQGAFGLATQDLKDSGRVNLAWTLNGTAAAATAETLMTMTESRDGAATGTFSSKIITSGKRLRLTAIFGYVELTTGTSISRNRIRIRVNTAGAATATSPLQLVVGLPHVTSTTKSTSFAFMDLPDGMEWLGDGTKQIGVTWESPDWSSGTTVCTLYLTIFGFEY